MTSPVQTHRLDVVALLFGVMFLAIGAVTFAHEMGWIHGGGRVSAGVGVVALGLVAVVAAISRLVNHHDRHDHHDLSGSAR